MNIYVKTSFFVILMILFSITTTDAQKPELVVQTGHSNAVNSLAFSPDGRLLASGSWDNTIKLWDIKTGKEFRTLKGHSDYVWDVKFSPDGERLASCDKDGSIIIWDVYKGNRLFTLSDDPANSASVWSIDFNNDGSVLASGGSVVKLWDTSTGQEIKNFSNISVNSIVFKPNSNILVVDSGNADSSDVIRFWNIDSGKELKTIKDTVTVIETVTSNISVSPDGKIIAKGGGTSDEGKILFWNTENLQEVHRLKAHKSFVLTIAYNPDGSILASGSVDGTVKLWNTATYKKIHHLKGHQSDVHCIAFNPDGDIIATGSLDGAIKLWNVNSGREIRTLKGLSNQVYSIAFNFDDAQRILISGGSDKSIRLWNMRTGFSNIFQGTPYSIIEERKKSSRRIYMGDFNTIMPEKFIQKCSARGAELIFLDEYQNIPPKLYLKKPTIPIHSVKFSPDNTMLATGNKDGSVRVWPIGDSGESSFLLKGHEEWILDIAFSIDGKYLASTGSDNTIRIWDIFSKKEVLTLPVQAIAFSLDFSSNAQFLASGGQGYVIVWDYKNGKKLHEINLNTNFFSPVRFSPDGKTLAMTDENNSVSIWNVRDWRLYFSFNTDQDIISTLAFSPDGSKLATGSLDKSVKIWDSQSGKEIHTLSDFVYSSYSLAFSPDGQFLAGGDLGSGIKIWDVKNGKLRNSLEEDSKVAHSVAFSSDGRFLSGGGEDTQTFLWDRSTEELIATLLSCEDGDWLVISSDQRFDGTEDALENLLLFHIRDDKPVSAKDYFYDYYSPGLLQQLTSYGHSGSIQSISITRDFDLLASGSKDHTIRLWDLQKQKEIEVLRGHSYPVNYVVFSPDGKFLASISKDHKVKIWDVKEGKEIHSIETDKDLRVDSWTDAWIAKNLLAFSPESDFLAISGFLAVQLVNIKNGFNMEKIEADTVTPVISFSPKGKILSISGQKGIKFIDSKTKEEILNLPPHGEKVTCVTFSNNGEFFASGSVDETIKIWHVQTGQELQTLKGHSNSIESVMFSPDDRTLASAGSDTKITLWDFQKGKELASFIGINEKDYVIITSDNYYTASKNGLKGVAFRIDNQPYPFEQFDLRLNRPDIVLQRIGYAPQEQIDAYHQAYQKRLKKMGFTEEMLGKDFHLPEIEILNRDALPLSTADKHLSFTVKATDSKYLLDRLNVFVNDVPIYGTGGIDLRKKNTSAYEQELSLELSNGRNKIQVSVLNQQGAESLKETFEVEYTSTPVPPELYVVAVGVSEYADINRNLKYAAKDGIDIVTFFQQHRQNFNKVHVQKLLNTDATKENILAVKKWLKQTKVDDQVILFFAGHGLLDDQLDYYFATTDIDFNNPSERGLPYEAIEGLLDGIPARKKLLLMDTCHSGEVDKEEVQMVAGAGFSDIEDPAVQSRSFRGLGRVQQRQLGLQNSFELLRELFANLQRGSGAIVISSASGLEFAYESGRYRNGLFTYAVLEGLQGKADNNDDEMIQVSELRDYVTAKVQDLTKNRQTPTVRQENLEFDFRVY